MVDSQPAETENGSPAPVESRRARRTSARALSLSRSVLTSNIFSALIAGTGLLYGLWIRVQFFRSFPDPLPTPDSWSYLTGTFSLLQNGQFDLFSQRTPAFPLLVWLTLAVFRSFAALTVVQGALTLISAGGVAHVVRAYGGPWKLPAALAIVFLAVHPQVLYWEHFLLTEGSFQALFTLALCAIALACLRITARQAAIAGVLTSVAVLIRPQGMFLTPLMLLVILWSARRLGKRKVLLIIAAAAAGPLLMVGGWSVRNRAVHGFFGLSNIGSILLFGTAAPWIDFESPTLAEDKALIANSIRLKPDDMDWVMFAQDGPGYLIDRKYANDPHRRDEVYEALAREAILHHPLAFAQRGFRTTYRMITYNERYPDGYNTVQHPISFVANWYHWTPNWDKLEESFPVSQYRAALDQTKYPIDSRTAIFDRHITPIEGWETVFIRGSLIITLASLLSLLWLRGPRRLVVALGVASVILLIVSAGFLSNGDQRYLSTLHGAAALVGALTMSGLAERWLPLTRSMKLHKEK